MELYVFPFCHFQTKKIISFAKRKFQKVRKINKKKQLPPKEMIKYISTLEKLKKRLYHFEKNLEL